jgi:hypothetical protein
MIGAARFSWRPPSPSAILGNRIAKRRSGLEQTDSGISAIRWPRGGCCRCRVGNPHVVGVHSGARRPRQHPVRCVATRHLCALNEGRPGYRCSRQRCRQHGERVTIGTRSFGTSIAEHNHDVEN